MNISFLISLFVPFLVCAEFADYRVGTFRLYLPGLDLYSGPITANFNGQVSIDPSKLELSFRLQNDGSVKEMRRQGYLNINRHGQLVLKKDPQTKFALDKFAACLTYKNEMVFDFCEDFSIGLKGSCNEAVPSILCFKESTAPLDYDESGDYWNRGL